MKTFIAFAFGLVLFTSCDIYMPEDTHHHDHSYDVTGRYELDEYSETYRDYTYYSVTVTSGWRRGEIIIHNFYDLGHDVTAYLDGNSVTIPFQIVDGFEIEGHGRIVYDELDLYYSVTDRYHDSPTDFCDTEGFRVSN